MEILIDGVRYVPAEPQQNEVQFYCVGFGGATPDDLVREMVNRFLGWKLPEDFAPDCGISFQRESDYEHPEYGRSKYEPIGTNLFDAEQAEEMVRHMLGLPNERCSGAPKASPET